MRESSLEQITFTLGCEQVDGDYTYLTVTCDDTERFIGDFMVFNNEGKMNYSLVDIISDQEDTACYFNSDEMLAIHKRIKAVWQEHDYFTDSKMEVTFGVTL